jgi:hypothetical protein
MHTVRRLIGYTLLPAAMLVCVTISLWQQAGH